jgi:hypothetical protein
VKKKPELFNISVAEEESLRRALATPVPRSVRRGMLEKDRVLDGTGKVEAPKRKKKAAKKGVKSYK